MKQVRIFLIIFYVILVNVFYLQARDEHQPQVCFSAWPTHQSNSGVHNEEIHHLLKKYYEQAYDFIVNHKNKVEQLAHALLEHETLDSQQIYEQVKVSRPKYDFEINTESNNYKLNF